MNAGAHRINCRKDAIEVIAIRQALEPVAVRRGRLRGVPGGQPHCRRARRHREGAFLGS